MLQLLDFLDLLLNLSALIWVQSCHIDVGVLRNHLLLLLDSALLQNFAAWLLKHIVNSVLDNLVDLVLAR